MNEHESEICAVINAERVARGLPTLRADTRLAVAARGHAEDMAQHPGMIHEGSDGSDQGQRIARAGYRASRYSEVVGWGFGGDPAAMVAWWLQSAFHNEYILDPAMTDIGAGYATGLGPWGSYWTVDMGAGDSQPGETFWAYAPVTMGGG